MAIIDCHGHVSAPVELWAYKATLLAHRGSHGRGGVRVTDEQIIAAATKKAEAWPASHIDLMKRHGTDLQLISPRPFQMMHVPYTLHFINEESIAVCNRVNSTVLEDFPDLKIVVSHGGGAIPYQLGRFESASLRTRERFSAKLRKLYFDTVLYTPAALRLLIETVGADRCLFGTECPGVGSSIDPETGETMDHIAPHIESFEWLSAEDKRKIFEDNARRLFRLP
jgi:hypothetical protein